MPANEPRPKYVLVPGWVVSRTDGQRHFIGSDRLVALYGVSPRDCVVQRDDRRFPAHWPRLHPDSRGLYRPPISLDEVEV